MDIIAWERKKSKKRGTDCSVPLVSRGEKTRTSEIGGIVETSSIYC